MEPCRALTVQSERTARRLRFVVEERKCARRYFYDADRDFGLFHTRLQTWFPCTVQVCMNGRERLGQQLTGLAIAHTRVDNCVTAVADVVGAQRVLDQLSTRRWARLLRRPAERVNPLVRRGTGLSLRSYYRLPSTSGDPLISQPMFRAPTFLPFRVVQERRSRQTRRTAKSATRRSRALAFRPISSGPSLACVPRRARAAVPGSPARRPRWGGVGPELAVPPAVPAGVGS